MAASRIAFEPNSVMWLSFPPRASPIRMKWLMDIAHKMTMNFSAPGVPSRLGRVGQNLLEKCNSIDDAFHVIRRCPDAAYHLAEQSPPSSNVATFRGVSTKCNL